ncbi:hypothetical protein OIU84_027925 [Salix udensis]|uniref:Protein kinase domain-containing protein n=1 Tax=Salix udensis TaxID=889485 RepID=A0AAD6KBX8_9ROSI|nr:hypothetical protein OIU84_027925 [Salix udensis]
MLSGALPPFYAKEMYRSSFHGKSSTRISRKKRKSSKLSTYRSGGRSTRLVSVSFEILDFLKEDNVIGSGASGKVYKAVLSNGETVAVKKLGGESRKDSTNHSSEKDEFEAEVETLGRIRHKNIVRLWCCCNTADCKLLVYEYMPNGSLGDFLHGSKGGSLDWPTRLLRLYCTRYYFTCVQYAYTLRVNEKSDIYSFGVVILELVTGRLPVDPEFGEKDLVKWVCATLDQNGVDHVVDTKLDSRYKDEISKILEIGLRCTTAFPIGRPSMRRVVKMLQEAGGMGHKPEADKNDEKPSPCYPEEVSDQGSLV